MRRILEDSKDADRRFSLPSLRTALLVYGMVSLIVLGMFITAYQRDQAANPDCTDVQIEIDLSDIAPDSELKLSTPEGGVCTGDVIYEDASLCREGIKLFESVMDQTTHDSVQFRLADCILSVEKITRR